MVIMFKSGQAANLPQGTHTIHSHTHSYGQFESPISLPACLWTIPIPATCLFCFI
uniref:Uncharacterized protein n=1 Tax=Anguilla anguilla TaxID=7936 RepID=A0A0E9QTN3_ANGAN